jgi:hypothetical protein
MSLAASVSVAVIPGDFDQQEFRTNGIQYKLSQENKQGESK